MLEGRPPLGVRVLPDLLPRIFAGDRTAVRECIDRYGTIVWSMARRACRSTADAEACALEIFVELWRSAGQYDSAVASEPLFVAMTARRRLLQRRRERGDDEIPSSERSTAGGGNVSPDLGVEALLAAKTLELLPPIERQVLVLTTCHGLTYEETAVTVGAPVDVVRAHAHRALGRVRETLDDLRRIESSGAGTQPLVMPMTITEPR